MTFEHQRMTDRTHEPAEHEIQAFIGKNARKTWTDLREIIENDYGLDPETLFYGERYGWTVRYRKSGKSLCSLFPEKGGFTVLIVLGGKEVREALSADGGLSSQMLKLIGNAKQLHDGRWLWIRVTGCGSIEDLRMLLQIKRRPKKASIKEL